jgi:hypothetical protein
MSEVVQRAAGAVECLAHSVGRSGIESRALEGSSHLTLPIQPGAPGRLAPGLEAERTEVGGIQNAARLASSVADAMYLSVVTHHLLSN